SLSECSGWPSSDLQAGTDRARGFRHAVDEVFETFHLDSPEVDTRSRWRGTEGTVGIGDVVFGAVALDEARRVTPAARSFGVFGWRAELAQEWWRGRGVGVDELREALVDRVVHVRESFEVLAVLGEVGVVVALRATGSFERVVDAPQRHRVVVELVVEDQPVLRA